MNLTEMIKERTVWLIGAVLVTIPLMTCYPILRILGMSENGGTIVTVCLSGVAYILLVTRIEPFLRKILSLMQSKAQNEFKEKRQ